MPNEVRAWDQLFAMGAGWIVAAILAAALAKLGSIYIRSKDADVRLLVTTNNKLGNLMETVSRSMERRSGIDERIIATLERMEARERK